MLKFLIFLELKIINSGMGQIWTKFGKIWEKLVKFKLPDVRALSGCFLLWEVCLHSIMHMI